MKWKASFRKLTALLLSAVLMLSLCTTAFATEGEGEEGNPEENIYAQLDGCSGDTHAEDCPLYQEPNPASNGDEAEQTPPACDRTLNCPAAEHNEGCLVIAVKEVQTLIDALPDAAGITQSNAQDVKAKLDAIDAKKGELSQDQQNALACSKYEIATKHVNSLLSEDKAPAESTPVDTAEPTAVENLSPEPTPAEKLQQMIDALPNASSIDPTNAAGLEKIQTQINEIKNFAQENNLTLSPEQEAAIQAVGDAAWPSTPSAEDGFVQIDDQYFTSVEEAIKSASSGDTVTLLKDADIPSMIINKSITLDLNTHTLNLVGEQWYGLAVTDETTSVTNGTVIDKRTENTAVGGKVAFAIQKSGVLSTSNVTIISYRPDKSTNNYNYILQGNYGGQIILNSGTVVKDDYAKSTSIETWGCVGVSIYGTADAAGKLTIDGAEVNTMGFAVSGNGTAHNTEITIKGNSKLTSNSQAIYHPQAGTLNIQSGTITGATGIEMRAGTLNVTGGTIIGTGTPTSVTPNGNGSTSDGAGIAVSQHTTKLPITVNISGGNISGYSALYESNPQQNDKDSIDKIQINITGGDFKATTGGTNAVYSEDKTGFISGGTYNSDVSSYVIDGNKAIENQDNIFTIGPNPEVAVAEFNGKGYRTLADAIKAAKDGGTVTLLKDTTDSVTIPKESTVTLDLNGKTITTSGDTVNNYGTLTVKDSSEPSTGKLISKRNCGIFAASNSTTTFASGTIESVEGAIITGKSTGATINITGGTLNASDNAVVAGNGSKRDGEPNTINISGGTLNGAITTSGYVACGVYAPWKDNVNITGGTISVTGGAGVVARAGNVKISGGTITTTGDATGKVGDSRVVVPCSAIVYDSEANYPAMTDDSKITVTGGKFNSGNGVNAITNVGTDVKIEISGGTFSSAVPEKYCADNYHPSPLKNGTYGVHQHEGDWAITLPDCTKEGSKTRTCTICGTVETEKIPASTGHEWETDFTVDTPATCTTKGSKSIHCKKCDVTKEVTEIPVTDHSYGANWISDAEKHWHACENCGDKKDEAVHTFQWVVDKDPTVTQKGSKHEECTVCGYKKASVEIPMSTNWDGIKLEVKANRTSVRPGKTITYTLTVTNNTGTDLTDIVVCNTVDKNLSFNSSNGTGTYTAKDGLWTIPELKAGKAAKITVKYTVKSGVKDGTSLVYSSAITDAEGANGESLPGNVTPSGSVTVKVSNKLSLIPATGDTSNIRLWITVLAVALVALIVVGVIAVIKTRKKK